MTNLRIHIIMHVAFEGPGCIAEWISAKGHSVTYSKLFDNDKLPDISEFDWLIIMGGPMGVYDETIYHWLSDEKQFIRSAIDAGKTVLGICLGSQLIAEVLGAKVYPNNQKEIGWFPIYCDKQNTDNPLLGNLEEEFTVFHWHGDTFDLPRGSKRLFYSDITPNQAFVYNKKVIGLQFHFEVTETTLREMIENGAAELTGKASVWNATDILRDTSNIKKNNVRMFHILDNIAAL